MLDNYPCPIRLLLHDCHCVVIFAHQIPRANLSIAGQDDLLGEVWQICLTSSRGSSSILHQQLCIVVQGGDGGLRSLGSKGRFLSLGTHGNWLGLLSLRARLLRLLLCHRHKTEQLLNLQSGLRCCSCGAARLTARQKREGQVFVSDLAMELAAAQKVLKLVS